MKVKVSEVAILNGKQLQYKNRFDVIQYLDTSSVCRGKFEALQALSVGIDDIPSRAQRAVQNGTIVISTVRPNLEHYGYFDHPSENVIVSSGFVTVDAIPEKVDSKYLYYVLTSPRTTAYLVSIAATSVSSYPSFNPEDLASFEIEIEDDIEEQKRIAESLSDIDSKIANNSDICSDLESMAKLLYDYWFVQFDFLDENGKPYKSSGGKMVWNEELKREIPAGWQARPLSDISEIVTDSITPQSGSLYFHYSIPSFDENELPSIESGEEINSNKYIVPQNSVLVSKLNPQFKRLWFVEEPQDNAVCSTEFMPFISTKSQVAFLYSTLNSDSFYRYMVQSSSSSTGSRKRMEPGLCLEFMVAYPDDESIITSFGKSVLPMLQKMSSAKYESSNLASLRDYLLPMLMNAQVKVGGHK